jgi:hypothetical protein
LDIWSPCEGFDLIASVHGLHYVVDKLGLIARICPWPKPDGFFSARLDPHNICLADGPDAGRQLL